MNKTYFEKHVTHVNFPGNHKFKLVYEEVKRNLNGKQLRGLISVIRTKTNNSLK